MKRRHRNRGLRAPSRLNELAVFANALRAVLDLEPLPGVHVHEEPDGWRRRNEREELGRFYVNEWHWSGSPDGRAVLHPRAE